MLSAQVHATSITHMMHTFALHKMPQQTQSGKENNSMEQSTTGNWTAVKSPETFIKV